MKYLHNLKMIQESHLLCSNNFVSALEELGRINPYAISRLSLNSFKRVFDFHALNKKDYVRLGEMNLYRYLNGCLSSSRKYSMRMIKKIENLQITPYIDAGESQYMYRVTLPIHEFVSISKALASLLSKCNNSSYLTLTRIERVEDYIGKNEYSNPSLHTISPIQCCTAILSNVVAKKNKEHCELVYSIKKP